MLKKKMLRILIKLTSNLKAKTNRKRLTDKKLLMKMKTLIFLMKVMN